MKKKSNSNKEKSMTKTYSDQIPMTMATPGTRVRRPLQTIQTLASDVGGSIKIAQDLYSILTTSQDWGNATGIYQYLRVHSVKVEITPCFLFWFQTANNAVQASGAVCYNNASGTPTAPNNVLDVQGSSYVLMNTQHRFKYKILYPSGVKGPVAVSTYNTGIIGYLKLFFSANFPPTTNSMYVRYIFDCEWVLPA